MSERKKLAIVLYVLMPYIERVLLLTLSVGSKDSNVTKLSTCRNNRVISEQQVTLSSL